jgi:transaldolase
MTKLHQLHDVHGQSPWLDNLTRGDVTGGRLRRLIDQGIRGVTSNPTIIAKAVSGSTDYDRQLAALAAAGRDAEASYWALVTSDLNGALAVLRPIYERSGGRDGFVSVELAPAWPTTPRPASRPPGRCTSASPSPTCWSRSRPPPRASRRSARRPPRA